MYICDTKKLIRIKNQEKKKFFLNVTNEINTMKMDTLTLISRVDTHIIYFFQLF